MAVCKWVLSMIVSTGTVIITIQNTIDLTKVSGLEVVVDIRRGLV